MVALLVLAACSSDAPGATTALTTGVATAVATPTPAATAPSAGVPAVPLRDASLGATPQPPVVPPVRVQVPDLGIDMPVEPAGVAPAGDMALPDTAEVAAWYEFGPAPAAPEGSTLVAAHVDSATTGVGPFARLRDVAAGAAVVVTTADGTTYGYRVQDVVRVPKDTAPVGEWFDRTGTPRLVLVTCGGAFDRRVGHYADNVVVTALSSGG